MKTQNQQTKGFILNAKTITLFLIFLFNFSYSKAQTYTYRIKEISANPSCGGQYQVFAGGTAITTTFNYSYPGNINNNRPPLPGCYSSTGALPDSITYSSVTLCAPNTFTIPINGVVTLVSCNCGGGTAMHQFKATIQPDPSGNCNYLIEIYN